jgi:hypothetical protein
MARLSLALAALVGLSLTACGKDEDKLKPAPQTPYASSPSNTKPGDTKPGDTKPGSPNPGATNPGDAKPGASSSWTGTLQPAGVGITMQGTHKLVEPNKEGGDKTVVLLKTTNAHVELAKYEGKKVKVNGMPSPTVEGGQTIVDVQTIVEVP